METGWVPHLFLPLFRSQAANHSWAGGDASSILRHTNCIASRSLCVDKHDLLLQQIFLRTASLLRCLRHIVSNSFCRFCCSAVQTCLDSLALGSLPCKLHCIARLDSVHKSIMSSMVPSCKANANNKSIRK